MLPIEQFFPELSKPFKGIITCHQKPDGDAWVQVWLYIIS